MMYVLHSLITVYNNLLHFEFYSQFSLLIVFVLRSTIIPPVCPLSFPDTSKVAKECGGIIKNSTTCCKAMLSYVAHLQKQSFITNLQALNCASFLGAKLQKMNVSTNVYSSCQITLKDFSLQGELFKN
jgi:hypothetical protein